MLTSRDEVHRLVDAVPDEQLAAIGEALRAAVEAGMSGEQVQELAERLRTHASTPRLASRPLRTFASAGTLAAEPELSERAEEILRTDPGTAA